MLEEDELSLLGSVAEETGVPLYRRYGEAEAADFLEISGPTLRRLRAEGKIGFIRLSERKVAYFGFQLIRYLVESVEEPKWRGRENASFRSESTGSPSRRDLRRGAEPGTTKPQDRQSALALARRTFEKRKSD